MRNRLFAYLLPLLGVAGAAFAGSVSINVNSNPAYGSRPAIQDVNVMSDFDSRVAADSQAAGTYRTLNGLGSLPVGTVVTITYSDGSSEKFVVVSLSSDVGAAPVPNSQKDKNGKPVSAPGTTGGGGGEGVGGATGGAGGGGTVWVPLPPAGCYGNCSGKVTVGPIDPAGD